MDNLQLLKSFVMNLHSCTMKLSSDGTVALCGCYEFNGATNERSGILSLFHINSNDLVTIVDEILCPGILDICWISDQKIISALANGTSKIWDCSNSCLLENFELKVSDNILLSTDVTTDKVVFSDSTGYISLWNFNHSGPSAQKLKTWFAHQFEVWCVCFDRYNDSLLFSGADDSNFCMWDQRDGFKKPKFSIKHGMGVCSIQNHPNLTHIVSTGSYDEYLRVWDLRMLNSNQNQSTPVDIYHTDGGGVWRHKWGPQDWILIAAMHVGFQIVHPFYLSYLNESNENKNFIDYKFNTTDKLAYGIDWIVKEPINNSAPNFQTIISTCTFYDNQVDFYTLNFPKF